MNYTIISCQHPQELARAVNEHIAKGWKPLGGVSVSHAMGGFTLFAQAMIKE